MSWLKDEANRDILKMVGAAIAAVCIAGWAVFTYFYEKPQPKKGNRYELPRLR